MKPADLANTPVLRATLAVNGSLTPTGEAWKHILGWHAHELAGTAFIERVHPDDQDAVIGVIHAVYANGTAASFACRYASKNGGYLWLAWMAEPRPGHIELDLVGRPAT